MADRNTWPIETAIDRAHALLDSKPEWADKRSVNGRLQVGDLRALLRASERLQRIELFPGERCESSSDSSPCGPVEHHDSDGVPLCAECWADLEAEWLSKPVCPTCNGTDADCVTCDGSGRIYDDGFAVTTIRPPDGLDWRIEEFTQQGTGACQARFTNTWEWRVGTGGEWHRSANLSGLMPVDDDLMKLYHLQAQNTVRSGEGAAHG